VTQSYAYKYSIREDCCSSHIDHTCFDNTDVASDGATEYQARYITDGKNYHWVVPQSQ
jgi:hypothetical protein